MGIMTGNAGRHLVVSRVDYIFPNRMAELSLVWMTPQTYWITIIFQKGNLIISMHHMAYIAFIKNNFMDKGSIFMPPESVFMAVPTEDDLAPFQQFVGVSCMGAVTVGAAIAFILGQMTVRTQ